MHASQAQRPAAIVCACACLLAAPPPNGVSRVCICVCVCVCVRFRRRAELFCLARARGLLRIWMRSSARVLRMCLSASPPTTSPRWLTDDVSVREHADAADPLAPRLIHCLDCWRRSPIGREVSERGPLANMRIHGHSHKLKVSHRSCISRDSQLRQPLSPLTRACIQISSGA